MAEIIAEMCQNYNGDRGILRDMVYRACDAGADYAKIQTIHSDYLTHRPRFDQGLMENGEVKVIKRPYAAEYARLKAMDIELEDHQWFIDVCRQAGIKAMTTVFTRGVVGRIAAMGWDAVKVASYDCASPALLRDLKPRFQTFFVSTGATYDHEIEEAAAILAGCDYSLLHCVTVYPTPLTMMHLNRMNFLRQLTPKTGFSDHSLTARDGIAAAAAALSLGATVIERHFTILEAGQTKDGPVSINPAQLQELAQLAKAGPEAASAYLKSRNIDLAPMLGQENRELSAEELRNRDYYRGRFASKRADGTPIYNWEDAAV